MIDGGKGSKPRPISVAQDEYNKRWDAIFGRDLPQDNVEKDSETDKLSRYNKETQEVKKNV
jgi:hypothetical protein